MSKIADKKFEILEYVGNGKYTCNGLADKLNELTRLVENLPLHDVSGIITEIDNLKKFNVEYVNDDGTRVIEYDKDGMFIDANELDKKILSYR